MKIKLLYIISLVESSHTFENTFKFLDKDKFDLAVIFLNSHEPLLMKKTRDLGITVYQVPLYKKRIKDSWIIFRLIMLIRRVKPDIVHAHLIDGSFFGLIAAYLCRVKHRIYTRHHSTHHWSYAPHAVKYDKLINLLATKIIAVSELVKNILVERENVSPEKISIHHHGFDFTHFENRNEIEIKRLKNKYDLVDFNPVVGNISRFIEEKGTVFVVKAFKLFLIDYPFAVLVLANAIGVYKDEIEKELESIPKENYRIIEFETNIAALYHSFDIFTHVPIDYHTEAFGQIYVEALAAKIPGIYSKSGIASEFIVDKENALIVPYQDELAIYHAMKLLMTDKKLRQKIVQKGFDDAIRLFSIDRTIKELEKEYEI